MALRDSLEIVPESARVPLKPAVLCEKRRRAPSQYAFGDSLLREAGFSVQGPQLATSHFAGCVPSVRGNVAHWGGLRPWSRFRHRLGHLFPFKRRHLLVCHLQRVHGGGDHLGLFSPIL